MEKSHLTGKIQEAEKFYGLHPLFPKAFEFLKRPDVADLPSGRYDIDGDRLAESKLVIDALNKKYNGGNAKVGTYLGVENRKDALRGAKFVVNAIQVGLYDPCTIIDFEIPKKYGLRQTIGDTLGIGGIFRGLRTIYVLKDFARDMEEVCPDCYFLN